MKSNVTSKLLYIILALNLVSFGLYMYKYRYINKKVSSKISSVLNTAPQRSKFEIRDVNYGDIFPEHNLISIDGTKLSITKSNARIKCIEVINLAFGSELKIDINKLKLYIETINPETISGFVFIFLFLNATISETEKILLKNIQNKYKIYFAQLENEIDIRYYMIKAMSCGGYSLLIDKDNIVRFANIASVEDLKKVVNNLSYDTK